MRAEPIVAGDGIELHPRGARDCEETFALVERYRATLREWLPWIDTTRSVSDVRQYALLVETQAERMGVFDYALRLDGRVVGGIGLHEIDWANRAGAIGYWLAPETRGRGIVTKGVAALVTHAIERHRINRFEIRAVIENHASRRVAERLGFTLEGTLAEAYVLHERYRDLALYATTASRWRPPVA